MSYKGVRMLRDVPVNASHIVSCTVPPIATGHNPDPLQWEDTKLYVFEDEVTSLVTHKRYRSRVGMQAEVTISIGSPSVINWTAHNLAADTPISFVTDGVLPTGITASTIYYVLEDTVDTLKISATVGGAAINTSGIQSGTHTAKASVNVNLPPQNNTGQWLELGNTNRLAMFDESIGTRTSIDGDFEIDLQVGAMFNAATFIDLQGQSIRVQIGDTYDVTKPLVHRTVKNFYDLLAEPFLSVSSVVFEDLPRTVVGQIKVTVNGFEGAPTFIGAFKLGMLKQIGFAQYGSGFDMLDFSRKKTELGVTTVKEGAYSFKYNISILVNKNDVDDVRNLMRDNRAKIRVWIIADDYSSLISYSMIHAFGVVIEGARHSKCQLTLEDVT